MQYRADIDGLRAIAVLSVVFYHFFEPHGFNGYMGVDIFFVISGFLITSITQKDLNGNSFSLLNFYEKRIRRILPALTVVILFCAGVGMWLFFPTEGIPFSKSIIATSLFSSNMLFWSEAGYFDSSAFVKPLLHTWSLAIEEQFYILFPLFLMVLARCKGSYTLIRNVIACLILASLLADIMVLKFFNQQSAFYFMPLRAWELLCGGLLVYLPTLQNQKLSSQMSWLGAFLLIAGFFIPIDTQDFPGYNALLPVIGTCLIIYSGIALHSLRVHRCLSHGFATFFGKISYSLYLWHWPFVVFATYYWITEISDFYKFSLISLCIFISYLSWRYVEQPFRHKSFIKSQRTILAAGISSIIVCIALGGGIYAFYKNTTHETTAPSLYSQYEQYVYTAQDTGASQAIKPFGIESPIDPTIAIWGDSHASAIFPALIPHTLKANTRGVLLTPKDDFLVPLDMCAAIPDKTDCLNDVTNKHLNYILETPSITHVILAQRWNAWLDGWQKENGVEAANTLREQSLKRLIDVLNQAGKNVILLMQVPEIKNIPINMNISTIDATLVKTGRAIDLRPQLSHNVKYSQEIRTIFKSLQSNTQVKVVWPEDLLCLDGKLCAYKDDQGRILYKDDDHLSPDGALFISPLFHDIF